MSGSWRIVSSLSVGHQLLLQFGHNFGFYFCRHSNALFQRRKKHPCILGLLILRVGFPGGTSGKEPACQCRRSWDAGSVPGSGRSPGGGPDNPLQCSCLENTIGRGDWWALVHGVAKSQIQLKWFSMHILCVTCPAWGMPSFLRFLEVYGFRVIIWVHSPENWSLYRYSPHLPRPNPGELQLAVQGENLRNCAHWRWSQEILLSR